MSADCNHTWRNGPSPAEKKTVAELRLEVIASGVHGYWLRGGELKLANQLCSSGDFKICTGCNKAAFYGDYGKK